MLRRKWICLFLLVAASAVPSLVLGHAERVTNRAVWADGGSPPPPPPWPKMAGASRLS